MLFQEMACDCDRSWVWNGVFEWDSEVVRPDTTTEELDRSLFVKLINGLGGRTKTRWLNWINNGAAYLLLTSIYPLQLFPPDMPAI